MHWFRNLYDWVIACSERPRAVYYLVGLSVAESSFFPIPPDVLLVSMGLAKPVRIFYYALVTTVGSVVGGVLGYAIGHWLFQWLTPWFAYWGYLPEFHQIQQWFLQWGIWILLIAGFSPIPYKIFTMTAGMMQMALLPFIGISLVARGARFFLVAGLLHWLGPGFKDRLRAHVDWIGWMSVLLIVVLALLLTGCGTRDSYAPVSSAWFQPSHPILRFHRVRAKETLYSIAFRYGFDYRQLAKANHLSSPYRLRIGQLVYLKRAPKRRKSTQLVSKKIDKKHKKRMSEQPSQKNRWHWPTRGRVIRFYALAKGQKGIDIKGKLKAPIYAAASGKVAYAGNGLRGYGNLLIIKHHNNYLSAYAHNKTLLVKENAKVKMGQKIATMGKNGQQGAVLHFEIRRAGQPIDPLRLLRSKGQG